METLGAPGFNEQENEEFGRNVEIEAKFMRHAEKADGQDISAVSLLSDRGKEEAYKKGLDTDVKEHGIKTYVSPVGRAIETADAFIAGQRESGATVHKERTRSELGLLPGSKEFYDDLARITEENFPPNFDKLQGDEKQEAFDKAEDRAVDWWFSFEDKRPDPETASPHEIAVSVARLVDRYIRMADKLRSGTSVDLLNVSHKGTLEPFLREILIRKITDESGNEKNVTGFDKLEEIGGGMRLTESWSLLIKTNESGDKSIKINFRDHDYDIDIDKLEQLVSEGKNE